jgi:hypothetical protein
VRNRFRYLLFLATGGPADPPAFESWESGWDAGDVFLASGERWFRIVQVEPERDGCDSAGVWVVEPVR